MSKPLKYGRPWWEVMKEVAAENARLKAEVERLRKVVKIADGAVDCVIQVHDYGFNVSTSYVESLKREWNAAKEGKQS